MSCLLRVGKPFLLLLVLAVVGVGVDAPGTSLWADELAGLTFLRRYDIRNESVGLLEPSGLALSRDGKSLWTISDKTKRIYRLNLEGQVEEYRHFKRVPKGLEGICYSSAGDALLSVDEDKNRILKHDLESGERLTAVKLSDLAGYDAIHKYFDNEVKNKGLEGITLNRKSGSLYVVKEGRPGLLIEVSEDLTQIRSHLLLSDDHGFVDDDLEQSAIDYSGLFYDEKSGLLWIVSHQAARLFLFDVQAKKVRSSYGLGYTIDGESRQIKQAEGITYNPRTRRVYVVSDMDAKLYVYELR